MATASKDLWVPVTPQAHASRVSLNMYQDEGLQVRQYFSSHIPHRSTSPHSRSSKHCQMRPAHNRSVSSGPFVSPLAKIKREHRVANKAKHLRKAVPADIIDSLDGSFFGDGIYHHEGPYDATLASRQIPGYAPIDAVKYTNAQALAATPRASLIDSLTRKVPLQGVGMVPPGMVGPAGQRFDYEEDDIQRSQGGLGRWPGVEYLGADIKGKGESSFTIEEQEKVQQKFQKRVVYDGGGGMEVLHPGHHGRKQSVSDTARYPYRIHSAETGFSSGSGVLSGLKEKLSLRRRK